jgi:hypothetical protein
LFELRGVDRSQLISGAGKDLPLTQRPVAEERLLAEDDVAALFGIEMEAAPVPIASKAIGSPAQREHPLKDAPTAKRAAKANAASASDRKHAEAKEATASAVVLEKERRRGATRPAPSTQQALKRTASVAQPISAPPQPKKGRRLAILTVKPPRSKRPKAG